jgi:hypothetical protein
MIDAGGRSGRGERRWKRGGDGRETCGGLRRERAAPRLRQLQNERNYAKAKSLMRTRSPNVLMNSNRSSSPPRGFSFVLRDAIRPHHFKEGGQKRGVGVSGVAMITDLGGVEE